MSFVNYSDDEVKVFHPICEKTLNIALKKLNLDSVYEVKHHERYQGIIPDFIIINKKTKNILLVVEVKRTPSQVMSTRYRLQAQSYITNSASVIFERKYFALTNLEKTFLFKYDSKNTSVINQIVDPSPINTGSFSEKKIDFEEKLANDFVTLLEIAYEDSGNYILNYNDILDELRKYTTDFNNWHSAMTVIGFEFIRSFMRWFQPNAVNTWNQAITYKKVPSMLQNLVNSIDFKSLGEGDILNDDEKKYWTQGLLKKAYEIGNTTYSGDEFASEVHELFIKGHESDGMVPTDMELAAVLAELISAEFVDPEKMFYCDPAAGSGNLLAALIDRNPNILPKNIWANDKVDYLKDILTIRFGLKFPKIISPINSPKITSDNLVTLNPIDFENIDAILMNPPYVSGVKDPDRKKTFFDKIKKLSNKEIPITDVGQMPLEGPFLELVINLVKEGTVMGIIIPEQHLFGSGKESTALRRLLLRDFGLKKIFTYPRTGLFESVTKGTVILIGIKGEITNSIEIINSSFPIDKIDLRDLSNNNSDSYGIEKKNIDIKILESKVSDGWKSTMYPLFDAFYTELSKSSELQYLDSTEYYRGPADNTGEGKYLFITKQKYWDDVKDIVPNSWLKEGIQNVQDYSTPGKLEHSESTVKALCPPPSAFITKTKDNILLLKIINVASDSIKKSFTIGKQPKKVKTPEEIISILGKVTKKIVPEGSLLIPRGLRNDFKVFETTTDTVVSTNFIVIKLSGNNKKIFLSWILSIYGQLQIEMLSKPQEGMRKIECSEIGKILYPKNELNTFVPNIKRDEYIRSFLDYVTINSNDEYWTNELKVSQNEYLAMTNLMLKLIELRNP